VRREPCPVVVARVWLPRPAGDSPPSRHGATGGGRPRDRPQVQAFDLKDVRLLDGPFPRGDAEDPAIPAALDQGPVAPTSGSRPACRPPPRPSGGWEAPDVELRATASAIPHGARADAASTGDVRFKERRPMVARTGEGAGRARCQGFQMPGYLSAFPEELIDRVEARQRVWGALLHAAQDHGRPARRPPAMRQCTGPRGRDADGGVGAAPHGSAERRAAAADARQRSSAA